MRPTFICGAPGCRIEVAGIYCIHHQDRLVQAPQVRGLFEGETCRFVWRGIEREGVIEKVAREKVTVLVEIAGKNKFLKVRKDSLIKEAA